MTKEVSLVREQIEELKLVVADELSERNKLAILDRLLERGVITDRCLLNAMRKIGSRFLPDPNGEIHLTAADQRWALRLLEDCGKE